MCSWKVDNLAPVPVVQEIILWQVMNEEKTRLWDRQTEYIRGHLRGWMYVIIGSHFRSLEGKFLLIALVIVIITLIVIVRQMPLNVR
jgi:tryptophan-rich sensory protein